MTEQQAMALAEANRVRMARAALKRKIKAGELHVWDVLRKPPEFILGIEIGALVMCERRWGLSRARSLLARIPIRETRQLRLLTERQCEQLASLMEVRS